MNQWLAWLTPDFLTLSAQWVSKAFKKLVQFEKWARRITGAIFIIVGIRYCLLYIFEVQL